MGFPTKNDHFGVFWGYHHLRKPLFRSPNMPFFRHPSERMYLDLFLEVYTVGPLLSINGVVTPISISRVLTPVTHLYSNLWGLYGVITPLITARGPPCRERKPT